MKLINGQIFLDGQFKDAAIEFNEKIISVDQYTISNEDIEGKNSSDDSFGLESFGDNSEFCPDDLCEGDGVIDAKDCYIIPGLVDIHTHGCAGEDSSDGTREGLRIMSEHYASCGVTSWCPTTMTLSEQDIIKAVREVRDFIRPENGAKIAGVNLEGPFLSYAKRGAQNPDNLHKPDVEMLKRIIKESSDMVRLVTVAPEEPGAIEFIEQASKLVTVSLGHTACSYEQADMAFKAGAGHVTHIYNAMPPIHHRNPGLIPAAFDNDAMAELIVDGLHVHPSVVRMTHKLFGNKMILISDSIRCAGMPDGNYTLGGLDVVLRDNKVTLAGEDTIAGSSLHLIDAVKNCVNMGIPLEDSIYAATAAPSKAIGKYDIIGSLDAGKAADIVILDKELNIKAVFVDGKRVCKQLLC